MGNCIKIQSSKSWQDDDDDDDFYDDRRSEMKQLISHWSQSNGGGEEPDGAYRVGVEKDEAGLVSTEVKIRVTKKQLEELVSVADIQRLSVQEIMKKLASFVESETRHPHWKPALQSIPEVD